jgi:hypothetical protein
MIVTNVLPIDPLGEVQVGHSTAGVHMLWRLRLHPGTSYGIQNNYFSKDDFFRIMNHAERDDGA